MSAVAMLAEAGEEPETIHGLIREALEGRESCTDGEVALVVLSESLRVRQRRAVGLLVPLVARAVQAARREEVRRLERAAFRRPRVADAGDVVERADVSDVSGLGGEGWHDRRAALAALVRESFCLGDGRRVEWGAATVEEHEERVGLLRPKLVGLGRTVAAHEETIRLIRETPGASCLDDVIAAR